VRQALLGDAMAKRTATRCVDSLPGAPAGGEQCAAAD
jgi:hypothetical protein